MTEQRIYSLGGTVYLVESKTTAGFFYEVDLKYKTDGVCPCKAFNGVWCEHIRRTKSRIEDGGVGIEKFTL